MYFLEEFPAYTDEEKKEVDKYIAKKESDGSYDFKVMSDAEREQTRAAFEAISKVTGLQFVYPGKPTEGGIRIGTAKTTFENSKKESGGLILIIFAKTTNHCGMIYIYRKIQTWCMVSVRRVISLYCMK